MPFYDWDPKALPCDAQYFFNILILVIGINPKYQHKYLPNNICEMQYIEKITEPRPYAVFIFINDDLDEDTELDMQCIPHGVVEVSQQLGISWYRTDDENE